MVALTLYDTLESCIETPNAIEIENLCKQKNIDFSMVVIDDPVKPGENEAKPLSYIDIGPYRLKSPFSLSEIEVAIDSAINYQVDSVYLKRIEKKKKSTAALSDWFSRSYVWVITIFICIYTGIPFLAPVLENRGYSGTANGIYGFYSLLCHQLGYRSYFIGGRQPFYPREQAKMTGVLTYEAVTGKAASDLDFARGFKGSDELGYKIAICERDIAIYGSMILFGFIFQAAGRKIKGLRWYFWIAIALIPIAIDGLSQLPGLTSGWPAWLPVRESTPFLRSITGVLFGAGTAWYMYPMMEESMQINRNPNTRIAGRSNRRA